MTGGSLSRGAAARANGLLAKVQASLKLHEAPRLPGALRGEFAEFLRKSGAAHGTRLVLSAMLPTGLAPPESLRPPGPLAALQRLRQLRLPRARAEPAREAEPLPAFAGGGGLPRHLFVLVHGLQGLPGDLNCLRGELLDLSARGVAVHLAESNCGRRGSAGNTRDGIEAGGRRLAEEIRGVIASRPGLTDISLVGNSLGGLYCRYAAALLLDERTGLVAGLRPRTFLTTATPHLGVGRYGYLGLIPRWLQEQVGGRALGRSICELLLADGGGGGDAAAPRERQLPLLVRMASAGGDAELPFLPALAAFERRVCYANAVNDFLVAYETAALTPARGSAPRVALPPTAAPRVVQVVERAPAPLGVEEVGAAGLDWQRRMAAGLASMGWREVTVAFPGIIPLAHNRIVALERDPITTFINREGRAVVRHTAESLLDGATPPAPAVPVLVREAAAAAAAEAQGQQRGGALRSRL